MKCVHLRGIFEYVVSTETAQNQLVERENDGLIDALSQNLSGGTEETHKSLRITGLPAEIPTEHLL
jgi:hypothetical protein